MADVDRTANADVVQELDEFRTFAREGVDPTTAEPFDSPERMLRLYLGRQIPASHEVHLGMDDARVFAVDRSGGDPGPYDLAADSPDAAAQDRGRPAGDRARRRLQAVLSRAGLR